MDPVRIQIRCFVEHIPSNYLLDFMRQIKYRKGNRLFEKGYFFLSGFFLFMYVIQNCFICRFSDSTVAEDALIEPRIVATLELTARRSNYSARYRPHPRLLVFTVWLKYFFSTSSLQFLRHSNLIFILFQWPRLTATLETG